MSLQAVGLKWSLHHDDDDDDLPQDYAGVVLCEWNETKVHFKDSTGAAPHLLTRHDVHDQKCCHTLHYVMGH